jgi:hypothetical protein
VALRAAPVEGGPFDFLPAAFDPSPVTSKSSVRAIFITGLAIFAVSAFGSGGLPSAAANSTRSAFL